MCRGLRGGSAPRSDCSLLLVNSIDACLSVNSSLGHSLLNAFYLVNNCVTVTSYCVSDRSCLCMSLDQSITYECSSSQDKYKRLLLGGSHNTTSVSYCSRRALKLTHWGWQNVTMTCYLFLFCVFFASA